MVHCGAGKAEHGVSESETKMTPVPADLIAFLAEQRDSRESRRGLAVKLSYEGWTYATISSILGCTIGFVSQSKQAYEADGTDGLVLK